MVRLIYRLLGFKGLKCTAYAICCKKGYPTRPLKTPLLLLLLLLLLLSSSSSSSSSSSPPSSSSSSSSSSPLCRVFVFIYLRQTMCLGNTVLQLFCCYYSWCSYLYLQCLIYCLFLLLFPNFSLLSFGWETFTNPGM